MRQTGAPRGDHGIGRVEGVERKLHRHAQAIEYALPRETFLIVYSPRMIRTDLIQTSARQVQAEVMVHLKDCEYQAIP